MTGETVLVVEDDVALLGGIVDMLELAGYRATGAVGAAAALEILAAAKPDIVISDIMMPEMDGFEMFRAVRADPRLTTVPFIFLTARSERSDMRAGMRLGADDYITKPFDEAELLDAVASRIQRRDELETARRTAYASLAEQMITTLNHELRAPLARLAAFTELLEDGGPDLDHDEFDLLLQGVHDGVSRLSRVVADITLLADIRSGRAQARFERRQSVIHDAPLLVRSAAAMHREQAADAGVVIEVEVPLSLPPILGDEVYLRDALGRLLDNAIKFSRADGGRVRVSADAEAAEVRIAVADLGIGIPAPTLEILFEPFRQVDRASHEQQGLGTGLAICFALVQLHGGTIEVESTAGAGSTFTVRLPRAEADRGERHREK